MDIANANTVTTVMDTNAKKKKKLSARAAVLLQAARMEFVFV